MNESRSDAILNSAEQLMTAGEKDITVDRIARNAGIAKGSIYYYFSGKDEIIDAVIERSYAAALREYFESINRCSSTFEKVKALFYSIIQEKFRDSRKNIIRALHLQDDIALHHKMILTAIKVISPILTELLEEGTADGSVRTDTPRESAEMIVAMLTVLLDNKFFPSDEKDTFKKLKVYAHVLETCLEAEKGSFDFLFAGDKLRGEQDLLTGQTVSR